MVVSGADDQIFQTPVCNSLSKAFAANASSS